MVRWGSWARDAAVCLALAMALLGCRGKSAAPAIPVSNPIEVPVVSETVIAALDAGDIETIREHKAELPGLGVIWGSSGLYPVLNVACRVSSEEIVALLIESGCPVHQSDVSESTPLGQALNRSRDTFSIGIVRRLLDAGAPANGPIYTDGTPALAIAAMKDRVDVVTLLLERGAENTEHGKPGITPLEVAVARGRPEVVAVLLERFTPASLSSGAKRRLISDVDKWIRNAEEDARSQQRFQRDPKEHFESAKQVKTMVLEWLEKGGGSK